MECAKEELCLPPDKRKWVHTDRVPVVGERRILKVTAPFDEDIGDTFTTVFEPWQMFLNGWDSAKNRSIGNVQGRIRVRSYRK